MPASAVIDLHNSFGAAFVGLLVSTMLFGFTIAQTWTYYWNYENKDSKGLKLLIAFITVMDTFHTFLCAYVVYWYLVLNFGNVENLSKKFWALDIQASISAICTSAVHFYYARRIYVVSRSIISPIIIVVLVVGGNIIGFVSVAEQFGVSQISQRFHVSVRLSEAGMCIALVVDVLTAAVMCWSLYRKKTGLARADSIIMTLMSYSINSGLLTSLLDIGMIVSYLVEPSSLVWLAFFLAASKCYVTSLLAMLNSRDYLRDRLPTDNPFNLSSIRIDAPSEAYGAKSRPTGVSVTVHRSTASNFALSKFDRNSGPTFEVPTLDITIIPSQCQTQPSES